jgi:hypothetical protein
VSVILICTSSPFVRCGKKLKLSSDGGDSGNKKCSRGCGCAYGGVWRSLESGGRFCVGAFGRSLASVAVKMFSHLIYFIKKFYKFCTLRFERQCCSKLYYWKHKKGLYPSTLMGYTTLVSFIVRNSIACGTPHEFYFCCRNCAFISFAYSPSFAAVSHYFCIVQYRKKNNLAF